MLLDLLKAWFFSPIRLAFKLAFWLVILSGIALTVLYFTFDANYLKGDIEHYLGKLAGVPAEIRGDISFGMDSARPSMVLHDVKIGEKEKSILIFADRMEIAIPFQKPEEAAPLELFVRLNNLHVENRILGDWVLPIRLSGKGMEVTGANAARNGGSLKGNFNLTDDKLHVDLKGVDISYADLQSGLSGGRFQADVRLDMRGGDLRTLTGNVTFLGGKGKIIGDDYQFWTGDVLQTIFAKPKKETKLECALMSFDIKKGIAAARAFIIDTEDVTIHGTGSINLAEGYMDARLAPKPKKPALINLATPVLLRGKFGEVKVTPDPTAVVTTVGGLLLGAITPAAALLPMMTLGASADNPCLQHVDGK